MALATSSLALDPGVSDYEIISLYESSPGVVTCTLQATFCSACNPNSTNDPGCPAFTHGFPPGTCPTYHDCGIYEDGRFAAVRLTKIPGGTPQVNKMVLNTTNWPLAPAGDKHKEAFTFSGLSAGDVVEVWGELYCSWCYHWYACPETLTIAAGVPAHTPWGLISLMCVLLALATWIFFWRRRAIRRRAA